MSLVTTHVLDAAAGRPAVGVEVRLDAGEGATIATGRTDDDGRVRDLGPEALHPGDYRIVFETGPWFEQHGMVAFYPRVVVEFTIADGSAHHHVPILLSPFAYSTYRGS